MKTVSQYESGFYYYFMFTLSKLLLKYIQYKQLFNPELNQDVIIILYCLNFNYSYMHNYFFKPQLKLLKTKIRYSVELYSVKHFKIVIKYSVDSLSKIWEF